MWIVLPDCFVSVVADADTPVVRLVRARLPGDLERFLGPWACCARDPGIEETPDADYRFRVRLHARDLESILADRVEGMTYTNVKGAVSKKDDTRAFMMSRMWAAGLDAQREALPGATVVDLDFGQNGHDDDEPVAGQFRKPLPQLDLFEGRRRRDRGMIRAESNTDPEWRRSVLSLCQAFISRPAAARRLFTAEDLREWCEPSVGQPHHHNAWSANLGGVIRSWKSRGLIEQVGSQEARRAAAHARLMRTYRVLQ